MPVWQHTGVVLGGAAREPTDSADRRELEDPKSFHRGANVQGHQFIPMNARLCGSRGTANRT